MSFFISEFEKFRNKNLFNSLTQKKIKNLAGETIYDRGLDYFQKGAVTKIWLEDSKLFARVSGSRGNYEVEIEEQDGKLDWKCNCPYDGYICKHIVAAGLEFLNKKGVVVSEAKSAAEQSDKLREKLLLLDKEDLADLLALSLKTNNNWKNTFLKKMAEKLDLAGFKDNNQQIYEDEFCNHFDRACEILEEFNQYGGGPEEEEDEAYEELEEIKELFQKQKLNAKLKKEFFDKMFYYYDWDNSGLSDTVMDTIFEIASGDEDWRYIVKKLEVKKQDNNWRKKMIADIYKNHLKDEENYLKLREKNLEYGGDYYDLVDFWHKKGEVEKAVQIAKEGAEKCKNGSGDLLEYLFRHYKKQDYDKALDYLKKIYLDQNHFDNYKRLKKF
ncbi:SWIM zinc finger family protein, partial [Patescibacteria group bacterium]|nr:SWIM zinc finger family protein [Patescibacteria group bacterium]